jgi:hypothetical protein
MPLFGFEETRISFSAFVTRRILSRGGNVARPFMAEGADGANQARLQMIGSGDAGEAVADESAEAALHVGAALTFGAKGEMTGEILLLFFSELAVEKEVDDALYIITEHQWFLQVIVTTSTGPQLPRGKS